MTDKQIIIDGIDVCGCELYNDGKCLCEFNEIDRKIFRYYSCKKFPNCYYKQLLRKEQECEELKEQWEFSVTHKMIMEKNYIEQLNQLKAEVKSKTEYIQEQRDIINQYSKEIEMYKKCQGKRASKREEELKAKNDELKKQHQADKGLITSTGKMNYQLLQEYDKQKTALTEIKEIAEKLKNFYEELGKCEDLTVVRLKQILQKISECEGNND